MADARSGNLPLVGSDESDWTILFGQWGMLLEDRNIGNIMHMLGWLGMVATVAWLAWRVKQDAGTKAKPLSW
jgi:hypothetical protein